MKVLLLLTLALPLLGSAVVLLYGQRRESMTFRIVSLFTWSYVFSVLGLFVSWGRQGFAAFEWIPFVIYESPGYEFPFALYFDFNSAVFLGVTTYIIAVIIRFCRYYMHREGGYARFFATILLFTFGMTFLTTAGTVDLFFAAWEILGVSSFLLIAFYRHRLTPVRNALTVYSVYRFCDVGVLMGAWIAHMIWHRSQLFSQIASLAFAREIDPQNGALIMLSFLVLLAAAGKSAQFPFCFWLPRAMEGPTPSSALFYGALSVHAGVFLLIRTFPLWHAISSTTWAVGIVGLISAFLGTLSGRTQSNIKGQIAYASLSQVGLMLFELALGFPKLALLHFVANAAVRSYQLLISPSVVVYVLRVQGTPTQGVRVSDWSWERLLPGAVRSSLYAFAFNEGYLLALLQTLVVTPLKRLGDGVHRLDGKGGRGLGILAALVLIALGTANLPISRNNLAIGSAILMCAASLSALSESRNFLRAWNAVGFSCFFAGVTIQISKGHMDKDVFTYFLGTLPAWIVGIPFVQRMTRDMKDEAQLSRNWGLVHEYPLESFMLFLCFLAQAGFPLGPGFIGEDALLNHAVGESLWLAFVFVFGFVVNGISLARLYSRLCFGPVPHATRPTSAYNPR